ncbi:uncharacterized protein LOC120279485 [Dioscorea cayenensis subsp. rotundata]|uniref:Uncharacterized protein LOC120279485 n=1 Tax=Dioscorea cayennensis subsp. rotundata TaxID=55577 RepID=A0AB40CU51_DIOCR|nr:uncharacterized protein LOC120279485 [Dioscorea cayenensis subsp. rotundata]
MSKNGPYSVKLQSWMLDLGALISLAPAATWIWHTNLPMHYWNHSTILSIMKPLAPLPHEVEVFVRARGYCMMADIFSPSDRERHHSTTAPSSLPEALGVSVNLLHNPSLSVAHLAVTHLTTTLSEKEKAPFLFLTAHHHSWKPVPR